MKKKKALIVIAALLVCVTAFATSSSTVADARIVKGNTAANIKAVQQRLLNLGFYGGRVDGLFGPKSSAAVKAFQKSRGLVADGIVGAKTEAALGITLSGGGSGASASNSDLNLLARCVHAEARGEPYTGQVAIAAVVLNRVRSSSFPNTVAGVIYQPWAFRLRRSATGRLT